MLGLDVIGNCCHRSRFVGCMLAKGRIEADGVGIDDVLRVSPAARRPNEEVLENSAAPGPHRRTSKPYTHTAGGSLTMITLGRDNLGQPGR